MAGSKTTLTDRENQVLALTWQCFDTEPKVNMEKLASLTGGSARFTLGKIKTKLRVIAAAASKTNPAPLAKGASKKSRPAKCIQDEGGDDDDDEEEKPKPKRKRAKKGVTECEEVETMKGVESDDGVKVKREDVEAGWGVGDEEDI